MVKEEDRERQRVGMVAAEFWSGRKRNCSQVGKKKKKWMKLKGNYERGEGSFIGSAPGVSSTGPRFLPELFAFSYL